MQVGIEHISAVMVLLTGTIAALWKKADIKEKAEKERLEVAAERERKRLERCEDMHSASRDEVKTLFGEVNKLRGEMDGVLKGTEGLTQKVLGKVEELNAKNR